MEKVGSGEFPQIPPFPRGAIRRYPLEAQTRRGVFPLEVGVSPGLIIW